MRRFPEGRYDSFRYISFNFKNYITNFFDNQINTVTVVYINEPYMAGKMT